jgi:hypothetical protein
MADPRDDDELRRRFDRIDTRLNELSLQIAQLHEALSDRTLRDRNLRIRSGQPFPFQPEPRTTVARAATTGESARIVQHHHL